MGRMLADFIKFLENKKLVKFDILGDGDEQFENRFRIQKYAFLAKRFGLDLPYSHSIYLYGPYSPELASDCRSMAKDREKEYDSASGALDDRFDADGFLDAVGGRDATWLEIGTTLVDGQYRRDSRRELAEAVMQIKDDPRDEHVSSILAELEGLGLMRRFASA